MGANRVFSNWGGEFFKKNLDYRANTNKILEKMNLIKEQPGGSASTASSNNETSRMGQPSSSSSSTASSTGGGGGGLSAGVGSFVPGSKFAALLGGGPSSGGSTFNNTSILNKQRSPYDANSPQKKY